MSNLYFFLQKFEEIMSLSKLDNLSLSEFLFLKSKVDNLLNLKLEEYKNKFNVKNELINNILLDVEKVKLKPITLSFEEIKEKSILEKDKNDFWKHQRLMINFIRHTLYQYDGELSYSTYKKEMHKYIFRNCLKRKILIEIGNQFSQLKSESDRQIKTLESSYFELVKSVDNDL